MQVRTLTSHGRVNVFFTMVTGMPDGLVSVPSTRWSLPLRKTVDGPKEKKPDWCLGGTLFNHLFIHSFFFLFYLFIFFFFFLEWGGVKRWEKETNRGHWSLEAMTKKKPFRLFFVCWFFLDSFPFGFVIFFFFFFLWGGVV